MHKIEAWLKATPYAQWAIEVASEDASFRRYFRLRKAARSVIVMDASAEKEALSPFMDITSLLRTNSVKAPEIYFEDRERGFLVLEDFGSQQLLDVLDERNFERLYDRALQEIVKMQCADVKGLPLYDKAFLHREMDLMKQWFFEKYLGWSLSVSEENMLAESLDLISDTLLQQPQGTFVHRDFHSRNIMLTPEGRLGIIDYQDAMNGAVTYDLVSLLKDLYVRFDSEKINALALRFRDMARVEADDATFLKWFDFMGLQRHIKVLGIFSRLWLRDAKSAYLQDLPLTMTYVMETAKKYDETRPLAQLMNKVSLPALS